MFRKKIYHGRQEVSFQHKYVWEYVWRYTTINVYFWSKGNKRWVEYDTNYSSSYIDNVPEVYEWIHAGKLPNLIDV